MAVDEYHLKLAATSATPIFRIYRWAPGTLSLGYFQNYQDRMTHEASLAAPLVRRPSGGGGILHDRELTYSLTVPQLHPWTKKRIEFYSEIHCSLIETLQQFGVTARFYSDAAPSEQPQSLKSFVDQPVDRQMCHEVAERAGLPFLCFMRRTGGDLVIGEMKVVGSAQYRRSTGFIQHGSILLERSPLAPELLGINDVAKKQIVPEEFSAKWLSTLQKTLDVEWLSLSRSETDLFKIHEIEQTKYLSETWNKKVRVT